MKINLQTIFRRIADLVRDHSVAVLSALFLSVGILMAYSVFQAFSGFVTPKNAIDTVVQKKPDTTYVKLVDFPNALMGTTRKDTPIHVAQVPLQPYRGPIRVNRRDSADGGDGSDFSGSTFAGSGRRMPRLKTDSIRNVAAANLQLLYEKGSGYASVIYLVASVLTLAFFVLLLYNLPTLSYALNSEKDPKPLAELFHQYGKEIEELGNPRKIKRFSNKLRFQFYYLSNTGIIGVSDPKKQNDLATILLYLERSGQLTNMDKPAEEGGPRSLAWFATKVGKELPGKTKADPRLIEQLYELNKNMIV